MLLPSVCIPKKCNVTVNKAFQCMLCVSHDHVKKGLQFNEVLHLKLTVGAENDFVRFVNVAVESTI